MVERVGVNEIVRSPRRAGHSYERIQHGNRWPPVERRDLNDEVPEKAYLTTVRREKRRSGAFRPWHSDGMELVASSYQELRSGTADVRQSRTIRGDGKTSRPGRTWSQCLGRVDRQHGPHHLLRRCGAQPTPDRATRNQHGEHDHGVQHRPVATAVLFALWRGSNDGRRDRWSVGRHSKVHGRADRGTAQRRGEILDLGIRLHLELLSHEFLINPGVLYRAGAVAGGGKREHELLRRAS